MRTIKTYRKVGAFYIACEEDFATVFPHPRCAMICVKWGKPMTNILIGEIFKELAQIQEDIGNLHMSVTAQHLALADLVPDFESRYLERMECARVLELKSECERRIQNLYEAHRKLSSKGQAA